MKSWLAKLKISSALDDNRPLPPGVQRAVDQSAELQRFAHGATLLHRRLKTSSTAYIAPDSLHGQIMRAVRSTAAAETPIEEGFLSRLIPAAALGLLIVACALGTYQLNRPAPATGPALAMASTTLQTGGDLVNTLPAAALSPLSDEMLRLHRDFTNAQEYLLASLP